MRTRREEPKGMVIDYSGYYAGWRGKNGKVYRTKKMADYYGGR